MVAGVLILQRPSPGCRHEQQEVEHHASIAHRMPRRHARGSALPQLAEYVAYDNTQRPHRSLGLAPPLPSAPPLQATGAASGRIVARRVLGGLHHVSERAA
jgi:hypothetical protein